MKARESSSSSMSFSGRVASAVMTLFVTRAELSVKLSKSIGKTAGSSMPPRISTVFKRVCVRRECSARSSSVRISVESIVSTCRRMCLSAVVRTGFSLWSSRSTSSIGLACTGSCSTSWSSTIAAARTGMSRCRRSTMRSESLASPTRSSTRAANTTREASFDCSATRETAAPSSPRFTMLSTAWSISEPVVSRVSEIWL